jgi:nitrite reductase/ring-hydroxylating ferredoxin subunit
VAGTQALGEGETVRFEFERRGHKFEGFVLRYKGKLFSYANSCPHWEIDLDLGDGRFYDVELDRIYCKNHGALFHPETGFCEVGPCRGRELERFPVEEVGDEAVVSVEG